MSFQVIADFENEIAKFFGAPYAVAVDCCTHGLELCLRMKKAKKITVPKHTYLSVPMLADKLNLELEGYLITSVFDGKEAIDKFRQGRFDLIILDVMLPEFDGFDVCCCDCAHDMCF